MKGRNKTQPSAADLRIAHLEDSLDHIRAVCRTPEVMSFPIDLEYIADFAEKVLVDAEPWEERPTRELEKRK